MSDKKDNNVSITFIYPDNSKHTIMAECGQNLLNEAHKNGIMIKANCGGNCACVTCHVYVEEKFFMKLDNFNNIREVEISKLETSENINFNSRLCCQIIVTKEMDNVIITIIEESFGMHH